MIQQKQIRLKINCQKGKTVEIKLPLNTTGYEKDGIHIEVSQHISDGCLLGKLRLEIENDPLSENANLAMEKPIKIYIPMSEYPEKITAMYLFNPWWTRPAFVENFQDIPNFTQVAFFKYKDRFACFVPAIGNKFKTYLTSGTKTELCLEMTACIGGQNQVDEPIYLFAEESTVAKATHKAFTWLAKTHWICLREARRFPEMFDYLGWCSWDAFYTDITEEKLRNKADEFTKKQVPVKWMLFDDGWLSVKDKRLCAFAPDSEKFPNGFKPVIEDIRKNADVKWFGVWHALGGYWNGISPESKLASQEAYNLCQTANGTVIPSPKTGKGFYDDWYKILKSEGIDFVKVDGQSGAPFYFENTKPVSEAARGMNEALESGAYRMDGTIINCMGMAMENILARPTSAISRNSNDFVPSEKGSFCEHLLENAYNTIYHNELYYCDWDMFWTKHDDAKKHSLLRAISGGPIYFSDRIGDTIPEILKPLIYADGQILKMERSAKPTEDCIFSNPLESGVLKLHNVALWGNTCKGGGIAGYNLTDMKQTITFSPEEITDLDVFDQYWVYDFFKRKLNLIDRAEQYIDTIEGGGFAWYVILPQTGRCACFGLLDKYVGFSAVESVQTSENTDVLVIHESGTVGFASLNKPKKVMAGALDVTQEIQVQGNFYSLCLSETANKAVLSIIW